MLKVLAILAVILVAANPLPGQHEAAAADHTGQTGEGSSPAIAATNNSYSPNDQEKPRQYSHWWDKLVAWPEGVTATALVATLIAIGWQAIETRRAVAAANKAMELGKTKERAKLLLIIPPLNPEIGKEVEAKFSITNVGESSAVIVFALAGIYILNSDVLPNEFEELDLNVSGGALKSGDSSPERAIWPGHPIGAFPQGIENEQYVAHFHCTIGYKDAFEDNWVMQFHYIWRHRKGEWEDQRLQNEYKAKTLNTKQARTLGRRANWKR